MTELQIVNGGQTTASLFHAQRRDKADLSGIFVQMKLPIKAQILVRGIPAATRQLVLQERQRQKLLGHPAFEWASDASLG